MIIKRTKRMDANAELERERLMSLINSMADGVIALDEKARIVVTNGAALNILNVNIPLANKNIKDVLKVVDKNNQPKNLHNLITEADKPISSRELRLIYEDGETINLFISISPVKLGFGKKGMRGFVLLLRDITREKSLEEERDEFISVVSHELRTPITIAEGNIGNIELLLARENYDNPTIIEALRQAHNQVTFLAGLINDLSTLSRAERGKLSVEAEDINVHSLINELADSYEKDATGKHLELKTEIDPRLEVLKSSRLYVKEILQNFITNAIKYTEKGHVTIGASQKDDGIEFLVADTGIGIAKNEQEKVFDKFYRSEDYRTRASSGTGLGLYVTVKLARLLHAEISCESELNKGSTFKVTIPNLK